MIPTMTARPIVSSPPPGPASGPPPGALLPGWAGTSLRPAPGDPGAAAAAFRAGAAFLALDQILRADPPWLGSFRMRQALLAAAASVRLLRYRDDARTLRDAEHLTRAGDDPGPAGRVHRAWRWLAARPARFEAATIERLCAGLGVPTQATPVLTLGEIEGTPVAAAARAAAHVVQASASLAPAEAETLALMVADLVLALGFKWAVPVPLLAAAIAHPSFRRAGRRPAPGDSDWEARCYPAYALAAAEAHARAIELMRRADRLGSITAQVRTRNREQGLALLLADDVVAPASLCGLGSDRAARRFCERLAELGGIRELTGRATFRLYGL
jgi:hypothetical protein